METLNRLNANLTDVHPEKILQFGGGNFLRAFADWMIDILNKETDFSGSVVVIKPTERGSYHELESQEGLFHVALDGMKGEDMISELTLVESISRTIQPYTDWDAYMALARAPEMRFIISNTTEAGIRFSEKDKLTDQPPQEFPGKLTQWLYARFQHFKGDISKGCIILPCELIENNGDELKATILKYSDHWGLGENFKDWIETANYFYNTLVDRIVSGYPNNRSVALLEQAGFKDKLLVAGEYYHNWTLQGDPIVMKELPFDQTSLNVQLVSNIADYRELKVRILNGAHTSLVPVGYLAGARTVKEAMSYEYLAEFVYQILKVEFKPTLVDLSEKEVDEFILAVIDRFRNPTLAHKLIDISLNSFSKFGTRILPAFTDRWMQTGKLPIRMVFALTALALFYKGEWKGEEIALRDNPENLQFASETWTAYAKRKMDLRAVLHAFVVQLKVADIPNFSVDRLLDQMELMAKDMVTDGIESAIDIVV